MKKFTVFVFLVIVSALTIAASGCLGAQSGASAAEFFKNKTISIIVPYNAGGGNDLQARIFAPYFQKYTGAASVVVENVAGAGGHKGSNQVYADPKRDGLTIGALMGDNLSLAQMMGESSVQFDVSKFTWIGRCFSEEQFLGIGANLPYTNPSQFAALPLVKIGASTPSSVSSFNAVLIAEIFGLKNMRVVTGYAGFAEQSLAVAQGEIHGFSTEYSVLDIYVRQGSMKPFCVMSDKRTTYAPTIPTIYEMAKEAGKSISGEQLKWMELSAAVTALRRSIAAPPDMPADRVAFLRSAFQKVMEDKQWQQDWIKGKFPIDGPVGGAELQEAAQKVGKLSPADISTLKDLLTKKYIM